MVSSVADADRIYRQAKKDAERARSAAVAGAANSQREEEAQYRADLQSAVAALLKELKASGWRHGQSLKVRSALRPKTVAAWQVGRYESVPVRESTHRITVYLLASGKLLDVHQVEEAEGAKLTAARSPSHYSKTMGDPLSGIQTMRQRLRSQK